VRVSGGDLLPIPIPQDGKLGPLIVLGLGGDWLELGITPPFIDGDEGLHRGVDSTDTDGEWLVEAVGVSSRHCRRTIT